MHKNQQQTNNDGQANASQQQNAQTNNHYVPHHSAQSDKPPIRAKQRPIKAKHPPIQAKQAPVQRQQHNTLFNQASSFLGGIVSNVIGDDATRAIVNSPLGNIGRATHDFDQQTAQVIDETVQEAGQILDEYIPIGSGIAFKLEGGVTWGIPIHTGGGLLAYVKRASKNTVEYHVRAMAEGALDVGVGGGTILGRGKKRKQKSGLGAGAAASLDAKAGTRLTGLMTYKIPVLDFINIIGPKSIIGGIFQRESSEWGQAIAEKAQEYQSQVKLDARLFANASGELGAGIKGMLADSSHKNKDDSWIESLKELVSMFGEASMGAEFGGGMEIDYSDDDKNVVNFYVEGGVSAMLKIPFLSKYIGSLGGLEHGKGIGAKISISYDKLPDEKDKDKKGDGKVKKEENQTKGEDKEEKKSNISLILYTTGGDLDVFEGPAKEAAIEINLDRIKALPELMRQFTIKHAISTQEDTDEGLAKLLSNFDKIKYTEQVPLLHNKVNGVLGSMIPTSKNNLFTKLKSKLSLISADFEIFTKFQMELEGDDLKGVIEKALALARNVPPEKIFQEISGFFSGKSTLLQGLDNDLAEAIKVKEVFTRVQGNLSTGFSGKLSAGLKAALNISGSIGAFWEHKLVKEDENLTLAQTVDKLADLIAQELEKLMAGDSLVGEAIRYLLGDEVTEELATPDEEASPRIPSSGGGGGF